MINPRIYLAIDNCFASKRWTEPDDWMRVIKDLGIYYVEASADNECDPLYMGPDYLERWVDKVGNSGVKHGVKVCNLYSGHGTYATLGLAHTDTEVRDRFLNQWLKPMAATAGKLGAGLGFFCHAFSDEVLQDCERYEFHRKDLVRRLAELAEYVSVCGCGAAGVEQMYTPHQIPWTVKGAYELLSEIFGLSKKPFYITVDVGHMAGQRKFLKPQYGQLKEALRECSYGRRKSDLWLGPKTAYRLYYESKNAGLSGLDALAGRILEEMDRYPHMFAEYQDGDPYYWLENLGCYSPIVHLQQTNGKSSSHLPFTAENNQVGIIEGNRVLDAIACSYRKNAGALPPKCDSIYLTIEVFASTASINEEILVQLKETVAYWRRFIPEDGTTLDHLLEGK